MSNKAKETTGNRSRKTAAVVRQATATGLLADARRKKILEWITEEGSARVRDLSKAFEVTEATIRQDLEKLEAEGFITRQHGGAFLNSVPQQVRSLALQHQVNMEAKRQIGRAAAELVNDGETIILDSGSTTTELAANLTEKKGLNVITNALNIALLLGSLPDIDIHMTGGHFKPPTLSLSGEKSAEYFKGVFAEKLFLATASVSFDAGLTFPSMADLYVKRAMIEAASSVYLVADSSKIGRNSFSSLGGIEILDGFVTDSGISDTDRKKFEKAGIEVIVA